MAICSSPGLGFDLDIHEDLVAYQHMEPDLKDRLTPVRGKTITSETPPSRGSYDISD